MRAQAIAALVLPLALAACSAIPPEPTSQYADTTSNKFVTANYEAADALLAQLRGRLVADKPLIMATVVNIDALDQSSTLGRLVSEQVSSRLAQGGLRMLEMKLRTSVYMKRHMGEMMLTREVGEVAHNHNAQAVVVGSYAESSDAVFVNVKVVHPQTNQVLAANDFVLAKDGVVRSMLMGR